MRSKLLINLATALAIATMLAAAAVPAMSQDTTMASDMSGLAAMTMPKAVFMAIQAGNMTGGDMTYTIPYAAKIVPLDSKEVAIAARYNAPLQGMCNMTTGTGILTMANALPATATIDYANKSTIPVAGANAVVAMQDFKMTSAPKGKGAYNFQFGTVTVYLPDGTAKTVRLDTPVRMSMNLDQMKLTIQGSPALAATMAGLLKPGATFPAGAAPVRLNDILAAK